MNTAAMSRRLSRRLLGLGGVAAIISGLAILLPQYGTQTVGTAVMAPAINGGETVVVHEGAPAGRGDLVVVDAWDGISFTVRVVGVGGDVVTCCGGDKKLRVNDVPIDEPYAHGATDAFGNFSVTVPPGRIVVLGDARSVSVDSRSHLNDNDGTLAAEKVRGTVVAVASPVWRVRPLADLADMPLLLVGVVTAAGGIIVVLVAAWPALRRGALALRRRLPGRAPRPVG